jgi:hypothetical protein
MMKITEGRITPLDKETRDFYNPALQKLIWSMMAVNQRHRPSIQKVLKSPIIQDRIDVLSGEASWKRKENSGRRSRLSYYREGEEPDHVSTPRSTRMRDSSTNIT